MLTNIKVLEMMSSKIWGSVLLKLRSPNLSVSPFKLALDTIVVRKYVWNLFQSLTVETIS